MTTQATRPSPAAAPVAKPPLAERALVAPRPRGAAVGHPAVLRHPRDDGRRHQPRRRRARLRHAAADRRGGRPLAPRGPDPLHPQLRHDRAAAGARRPSRAPLRRRATTRRREMLVTVGASEAVDLAMRGDVDPGDEVVLHEPSYVAYVPAVVVRRRRRSLVSRRASTTTSRSTRRRVEAAITPRTKALFLGYPCNPTGAVLPRRRPGRARADRRAPRPARRTATRSTTGSPTATTATARSARCPGCASGRSCMGGFSKAYAMTGWRVGYAVRARGDPRGDRQGPPVRDHVGPDDGPGRRARGARQRPSRTSSGWSREYDRRRRIFVDGLNAIGLRTFEPRGAFYAFPRITLDRASTRETFAERLLERGARRGRARARVRAVGRGPRAGVLRDQRTRSSRRRSSGSAGSSSAHARLTRRAGCGGATCRAARPRRSSTWPSIADRAQLATSTRPALGRCCPTMAIRRGAVARGADGSCRCG